ncbi:MAG TPA: trehalase family glycosidase [Candidatus Saccharimonadales bacterium]|nr:trehalase family glycosidase [Candidatus Saccharimonadales bacterium]
MSEKSDQTELAEPAATAQLEPAAPVEPPEQPEEVTEPALPEPPEPAEEQEQPETPEAHDAPEPPPSSTPPSLGEQASIILQTNDRGDYTVPAEDLYPHQWLWDSCFIAIGRRWLDVDRARKELTSLLRGQWSNGMLPHMVFSGEPRYRRDREVWRSWVSPYSPDNVATSGVTQPPMLAEAVWRIGQQLNAAERRTWYKQMLPALIAYHDWLYIDRDPHQEGLVLQLHPWETGLDNTPPWMAELHDHLEPWWIRGIRKAHLEPVVNMFRRDLHYVPPGQRFSTLDVLSLFDAQRRLRRKAYDTSRVLTHSLFAIEDLTFNCIFIRANALLLEIAGTVQEKLPDHLIENIEKSNHALESLWDEYAGTYWSRDFVTHRLLKQQSIASLMPLYAGTITKERAAVLVRQLENDKKFGPAFPVPSVPLDSPDFDPDRYWQGPSWLNTNWLIIDGLKRYGFKEHAAALRDSSLEMVNQSGFAEYFDPNTAEPLGAHNFSWTAALTIDLLHDK